MSELPENLIRLIEESSLKNQWAIECSDCGSSLPDTKSKIRGAKFLFNHLVSMGRELNATETILESGRQGYNSLAFSKGVEYQHSQSEAIHQAKIAKLEADLEIAVEALKFYSNEMNYSIDDYRGISGEMICRRILYSDSEERNDVYSYAGLRAREALSKIIKQEPQQQTKEVL